MVRKIINKQGLFCGIYIYVVFQSYVCRGVPNKVPDPGDGSGSHLSKKKIRNFNNTLCWRQVSIMGGDDKSLMSTSSVEMQPANYQSIPRNDPDKLEQGTDTKVEDSSKSDSAKSYWRTCMYLLFTIVVFGVVKHALRHHQHLEPDGTFEDDDSVNLPKDNNPLHVHLSAKQVGMTGVEGVALKDMHVERVRDGKLEHVKCYVGSNEEAPIATGIFEKNSDGQGWNYLSVRSEMKPLSDNSDTFSFTENDAGLASGGVNGDAPDADYVQSRRTAAKNEDNEAKSPDEAQDYLTSRFGMGYLEGFTTCTNIQDWYSNSYQAQFDGGDPNEGILRFLETNHDWMVIQADLHWRTSDYWFSIKGRLAQLHGLLAGIRGGCPGTHDAFGTNAPLLPTNGKKMLQDLDGHRDWIGQDTPSSDLIYHYNSPYPSSKFGTIYLASMAKQPSLIHLLIHNANGDLYQIGDKFNIFADKPNKKTGRRKDKKRQENKKYEMKNHTHFAEDDDSEDDDGDSSRWGRETMEINNAQSRLKRVSSSSRRRRANIRHRKRQLLRIEDTWVPPGIEDEGHAIDIENELYQPTDHCSSLVKLLANNSDVIFGHNTWDDYQNAFPRIFKSYEYPLIKNAIPSGSHKVDFSSSPGLLASIDDFYIVKGSNGANMGVMETSIDIYNRTYLDYIKPESVLAWARVVTANEMATTGADWANRFSEFASGTYIDQWMVLDLNKFKPNTTPQKGFFTVLEEMPGRIHWEDQTQHLIDNTYWASYNNPFYKDIRDMTGQTALCVKNSYECYKTDPRGLIFHKLQANISSIADFRVVMQYNHWQTDALSMNDSCRSIACRADLEVDLSLWGPHGAVDAKVSSHTLASSLLKENEPPTVWAKLGPTHDSQPPFCWKQFENVTDLNGEDIHHYGHPACFNFDWVIMPRREK